MERVLPPEKLDRIFSRHGKSLVVLDPELRLAVDIFPCEDGHTQERKLFAQVLETVRAKQLWIADRNMCTLDFLGGIAAKQASFVIREHLNLPWTAIEELKFCGRVEGGELWSQPIEIAHGAEIVQLRRIVLRLNRPSRHGDDQIVVLTNLPPTDASPQQVMQLYRERWQVERLFLTVTQNFEGEINTLAYPKAALFSFTLALVAYNLLATLRAALASVHGVGKIEASLSDFYLDGWNSGYLPWHDDCNSSSSLALFWRFRPHRFCAAAPGFSL